MLKGFSEHIVKIGVLNEISRRDSSIRVIMRQQPFIIQDLIHLTKKKKKSSYKLFLVTPATVMFLRLKIGF